MHYLQILVHAYYYALSCCRPAWLPRISLTLLLLAWANTPAAAADAAAPQEIMIPELRLQIVAPPERAAQLQQLAHLSAAQLRAHGLDPLGQRQMLSVRIADSASLQLLPTVQLAADPVPESKQDYHLLMTALLWRQFGGAASHAMQLQWLTAALSVDIAAAGQQLEHQVVLRSARDQVFPEAASLLANPPAPSFAVIYTLYAWHCHFLYSALRQQQPTLTLADVLQAHSQHATALDAVSQLALPFARRDLDRRQSLQNWYVAFIRQQVDAQLQTYSVAATVEALAQLNTITIHRYRAAAAETQQQHVALAQLPDVIKDKAELRAVLAPLQQQLFQLNRRVPLLLRPALLLYTEALDNLRQGKVRVFRRRLAEAEKTLQQAVLYSQRLDQYLENLSRELVPVEQRWPLLLQTHTQHSAAAARLAPEVKAYLDSL